MRFQDTSASYLWANMFGLPILQLCANEPGEFPSPEFWPAILGRFFVWCDWSPRPHLCQIDFISVPWHRRHIGYGLAISTRLSSVISVISRGCPDGYCGGKETSNCTGSASSSSWVANGGEGGGQGNFWTWSSFLWCPRKRVSSCLWKTQFPQQNRTFWAEKLIHIWPMNGFSWNRLL